MRQLVGVTTADDDDDSSQEIYGDSFGAGFSALLTINKGNTGPGFTWKETKKVISAYYIDTGAIGSYRG